MVGTDYGERMKKGPTGEKEIVELLQHVGFKDAYRLHQGGESNDIGGIHDTLVEVKFAKRWDLFKWIRKARRVAEDKGLRRWAIFAIHGDRRSEAGREVREVMIVDATFGAALLAYWHDCCPLDLEET